MKGKTIALIVVVLLLLSSSVAIGIAATTSAKDDGPSTKDDGPSKKSGAPSNTFLGYPDCNYTGKTPDGEKVEIKAKLEKATDIAEIGWKDGIKSFKIPSGMTIDTWSDSDKKNDKVSHTGPKEVPCLPLPFKRVKITRV